MTNPFKVRSTHRKNGRVVQLDPNFLQRAAAESFKRNLEAKYGNWYEYAVVGGPDPEPDAEPEGIVMHWDIQPHEADDWDTPRFQPTPEEQARHEAEIREIERREWKRFEGLDLTAKATPEYGEVYDDGGCRRCARTGQFVTGMLNGQPTGPGGACFKCQGKGYQTLGDAKRNGYWERHQRVSL